MLEVKFSLANLDLDWADLPVVAAAVLLLASLEYVLPFLEVDLYPEERPIELKLLLLEATLLEATNP